MVVTLGSVRVIVLLIVAGWKILFAKISSLIPIDIFDTPEMTTRANFQSNNTH